MVISDQLPDRAEALAARFDRANSGSEDDAFATDAVVIASSTDTHADLLIRAARTGTPAFCEKPISLDLESTAAAVEAIDAAGITVQMGFQRRYDEGIIAIKKILDSAPPPFLVRSQTHDPAPPSLDYITLSGGMFKDCLIHDIDAVRFVTGQEAVAVTANGTTTGHPDIAALGDFGSATALLEMSNGTMGQISGLRLDPMGYDARMEVFGQGGAWAAGWNDQTPILSTDPGARRPTAPIADLWERFGIAYRRALEAFVRVARGIEPPASNHHDAQQALVIAQACDVSAAEMRRVEIAEIGP